MAVVGDWYKPLEETVLDLMRNPKLSAAQLEDIKKAVNLLGVNSAGLKEQLDRSKRHDSFEKTTIRSA